MKKVLSILFLFTSILCAQAQKTEQSSWYVKGYTEETAKNYFDRRYSLDLIEGIWQSNDGFKYAIERDVEEDGSRSKDSYRVIILESSHNGWSASEIKGFITYSSINGVYSLKYYTKNSDGKGLSSQNVILFVDNPILVSFNRIDDGAKIQFVKLYPKVEESGTGSSSTSGVGEKQWSGSSIVIGDRYLATNNHVVDGARSLVISGSKDNYLKEYKVDVVAVDKNIDLAILKVNDPDFEGFGLPAYGISTNTSDVGTDVFVLGYPMTTVMGQEIKLTTGIISSKTGYQGDPANYQISAAIQPGNSGGPLFDGNGNLVGIIVAGITQAENVGYAIKLSYLRSLVESCSDRIAFNYENRLSDLPLTEKVKKISPFVYFVKANTVPAGTAQSSPVQGSQETVKNDPDIARDYLRAANQLLDDNKFDEAYDLVKKSVEAYPGNENHYLRAILAYEKFQDYDMALESAKYCVDQKYNLLQSTQLLASIYMSQEKWDEVIETCGKLLTLDRKNIFAYYLRGSAYKEKGDNDSALREFNAGLKFEGVADVNFAPLYNSVAYIYMEKKDFKAAETSLLKALELGRGDGNYLDSYGELMYNKGDYKECLRYMGAAIAKGKKTDASWLKNSYYIRGLANKELGFGADAFEDLSNAVEFKNEDAEKALAELSANNNQKSGKFFNMFRSPNVRINSAKTVKIKAIESTEESTIVYFTVSTAGKGSINVNPNTYIIERNGKNKLYVIDVDGIAMAPERTTYQNEILSFSLIFPPISEDCKEIDLVEEVGKGESGLSLKGIALKDNKTSAKESESISADEVAVTKNPKDAEGLIAVKSITKTSGWGGAAGGGAGFKNCVKMIQQEAAKQGCCMAVITNENYGYTTKVTATIYKRP